MRHMQLLLIEDEDQLRVDFIAYIKSLVPNLGYPIDFYVAPGEAEGLIYAEKLAFDAIVLDLELHKSDGDGFSFLKKLRKMNLSQKPYIVISTNNNSPVVRENARRGGADYIFWKNKSDYSPKIVMEHICTAYEFKMDFELQKPLEKKKLSIEDYLKEQITKNGFTDDMLGKKYVIDSILIVAKSNDPDIQISKHVFPQIAKKYKKSSDSINRAIYAAIEKAWSITPANVLEECYSSAVGGSNGAPTTREFVFYYANKIKDDAG